MAISFTPTKIARFVGALYGVALNNSTNTAAVTEIYARGFNAVANEVFAADFGTQTTAAVATTIATNLGLTGAALTDAAAYLEGQLNAAAAADRGAVVINALNLFAGLTSDATYGAAATAFEARVANAIVYSNAATSVNHGSFADLSTGVAYNLTTGFDKLTGTSSADTFNAYEQNGDTLNTGDVIDGGSGDDTLFADIHSDIHGGIAARTTSVETAIFRVQHGQTDSGDNNIATKGIIDAERMSGTNVYEDNNSRADLVIEDVRIGASQKTKDITIIMRDTDPGAVDYAVYFDQNSLRNVSSASSSINVRVLDTYSVASGTAELKDSPYGSFTFWYSADAGATYTKVELASDDMQNAQTITAMVTALQAQADAAFGAGVVTVAKGSAYSVPDSVTSTTVTSNEITLSTNAAITFDTTRAGSGWKATDTVPAISGLYTSYNTSSASSTDLVTSTVILDHVGRGSNGGDLIIGGLSTGATSSSKGVQQFDITVQDTSKLSNINSTNNTLQVVNIVNGTTDVQSDAYVTRTTNAGDLYVGVSNTQGNDLPGDDNQDNAYGFSDVRVINAATMTGKLNFTSEFTSSAITKYVNLVDTGALPTTDNIAVTYDGGTNNDSMDVSISGQATASASNIVSGREDFTFTVNGNAGNDTITVRVEDEAGGAPNWHNNQDLNNNITISGGAGDDTIWTPGAGDTTIDAGAGTDVVYTDNTGDQGLVFAAGAVNTPSGKAIWAFNTLDQTTTTAGAVAFDARNISNLRSDANDSYNLYKATLYVTFKGLQSSTITLANTSTYKTTDLEINQAIKNAINSDATLKNLLIARDGPANSLVVESLIDGAMVAGDLAVTIAAPTTALSTAELAAANTAWGTGYASGVELGAMGTVVTAINTTTDYSSALATNANSAAFTTGADSTATSDNYVTGGSGDDIIVLGTHAGTYVGDSSNEVVTYAASFGNDVIVNFDATAAVTRDHLNLSAFLGTTAVTLGALANTDSLVTVAIETAANDTATEIKALYDAVDAAAAKKMVYIAYSTVAASATDKTNNVAKVYSVTDGTGADDSTVTLQGTIDLADTSWATLTVENFTVPTSVTAEGASTLAPALATTGAGQTLTGSTIADVFTVAHAGAVVNGNGGNDTINITAGAATINDLNTGDVVTISAGATLTDALAVSAFVATSSTTNAGTATLTSAAAASTINMSAAGGSVGYTLAGAAGVDNLTGSGFDDTISSGGGADVISGGDGGDAISFSAANDNVRQTVQFSAATDGTAAGAVTGNDAITNFDANAGDATDDLIQIATGTLKTALDDDSDSGLDYAAANGADGGNQAIVGGVNQEATVLVDAEVEINVGDLTTAGLANVITELGEEIDFTALATGQEHLFIVNVSATQAGIILYTASTGADDVVDAADIQLLGIVTHNDGTNLVATDLTF